MLQSDACLRPVSLRVSEEGLYRYVREIQSSCAVGDESKARTMFVLDANNCI